MMEEYLNCTQFNSQFLSSDCWVGTLTFVEMRCLCPGGQDHDKYSPQSGPNIPSVTGVVWCCISETYLEITGLSRSTAYNYKNWPA